MISRPTGATATLHFKNELQRRPPEILLERQGAVGTVRIATSNERTLNNPNYRVSTRPSKTPLHAFSKIDLQGNLRYHRYFAGFWVSGLIGGSDLQDGGLGEWPAENLQANREAGLAEPARHR